MGFTFVRYDLFKNTSSIEDVVLCRRIWASGDTEELYSKFDKLEVTVPIFYRNV